MRNKILTASFLVLLVFNGCSNNADENKNEKRSASDSAAAPVIEVVQNENARETKVQEKLSDENQSKSYYLGYNVKSEYDPNSKPANEDASVRVAPRTAVDANLHVRSPYEEVSVSLLVRKLSKNFIVKCSACHNDYANGIIGPSLLKKDADYIFNKIADFKNGTKSNPLMNDLIKMMSDKEIREMAEEVYKFNQELETMRNK